MTRLRREGRPLYYGWVIALALAITEPVSWGVQYYAFSVFLNPMQADLGWSRSQLTAGLSLGLLVAGIAAVPVGRWLDAHGPRLLMTLGSIAAAALVLAWSRVEHLPLFYLLWAGFGLTMAATFYEPAFQAITTWFRRYRARALTLVTFGGGFASVLFIPLSEYLVQERGWREALVWLALILAIVTIPLHALALRRRPADLGLEIDGEPAALAPRPGAVSVRESSLREALRGADFRWLALAFALTLFVNVAAVVHLIPLLTEKGFSSGFAAAAAGAIGLMALPGRLIFTPLGEWLPRRVVAALIFATQAAALLVLLAARQTAAVWLFVILFGAGFGAITPARAALVADRYGIAAFGRISGVLALTLALSRAAAPFGASLVRDLAGDYRAVLALLAALSLGASLAVLRVGESG